MGVPHTIIITIIQKFLDGFSLQHPSISATPMTSPGPAWASAWTPLHPWRWSSSTYEGTCRCTVRKNFSKSPQEKLKVGSPEKKKNAVEMSEIFGNKHHKYQKCPWKSPIKWFFNDVRSHGWCANISFRASAQVTVDASTPPPPYRWCPGPAAFRHGNICNKTL